MGGVDGEWVTVIMQHTLTWIWRTLCSMIERPMTKDCPASMPLMPACMLMALVQNTDSISM